MLVEFFIKNCIYSCENALSSTLFNAVFLNGRVSFGFNPQTSVLQARSARVLASVHACMRAYASEYTTSKRTLLVDTIMKTAQSNITF